MPWSSFEKVAVLPLAASHRTEFRSRKRLDFLESSCLIAAGLSGFLRRLPCCGSLLRFQVLKPTSRSPSATYKESGAAAPATKAEFEPCSWSIDTASLGVLLPGGSAPSATSIGASP